MDKQMIEEMAEIISRDCGACGVCKHNTDHEKGIDCTAFFFATELYNAGYRKINENAVVILDEEMENFAEKLAQSPQMQKVMQGLIKAWEKETAEKFAERLKEKLNEWLEDNEDLNGKIDFGIAMIELIGVKSLDGEVISESLIDEICKGIIGEKV